MKAKDNKLNIAVLTGGVGTERQISLLSGECVEQALIEAGHDVRTVDFRPDNVDELDTAGIEVFFIAQHGEFGEDGQLQKILEDKNLCYTHSTCDSCRIAIDKVLSKKYFAQAGVPVPRGIVYSDNTAIDEIDSLCVTGSKLVVKPISHGSSVGVEIVDGSICATEAAAKCLERYGNCMIEEFIAGREITVGVLNGKALPIIEIKPNVGFYDYNAKYLDDNTQYLFDTISDEALIEKVSSDAVRCFESLGCRHVARVDFIITEESKAYALEINTIPGMTTHSCIPKAAAKVDTSMSQLCDSIAGKAVEDFKKANVVVNRS